MSDPRPLVQHFDFFGAWMSEVYKLPEMGPARSRS